MRPASPALAGVLGEFRQQLSAHFGPRLISLTLFGSHARGEAGPESDVDVAVVLDQIGSHAERVLPMELAADLDGFVVIPLVLSEGEVAFLRTREDLLIENLDREGVAV
jgi:uncharacterized protein